MSQKAIKIVRRIGAVERRAIYFGNTPAAQRRVALLWRAFSREVAA
jgi:hypothetical protein